MVSVGRAKNRWDSEDIMRALLIEDNKVVSDNIRTMLVPEEYEVDTVAFGEDGLANVSESRTTSNLRRGNVIAVQANN